jgi:hypothetical protein
MEFKNTSTQELILSLNKAKPELAEKIEKELIYRFSKLSVDLKTAQNYQFKAV